jgi:hypothetical protein
MRLGAPPTTCSNCGRSPVGREVEDGEWFFDSDEDGETYLFCPECWEQEFGSGIGRGKVKLKRGVADWVNANGGKLYLWGEPFGGFHRIRADTNPPESIEFARSERVKEFNLYVERDQSWPTVTLGRRWWGLRGGIDADTGYWVVAGG